MAKGDEKLWAILNEKLDTLRATGQLRDAIRVAEAAVELARRIFEPESAAFALSLEKLGQLHDQAGDRSAARAYLLKAHDILTQIEPPDEGALYRSARRLAFLSDHLDLGVDAIAFYEKAIELGTRMADLPYADLGTMLNNTALIFRRSGRQDAAEPYYQQALELYENHLGPDHPDVAAVLNNLAVFYTNEQRFDEAESVHLRALAIRTQALPAEHADIAQSRCNLAVVYHSRGDFERAAELYRAALKTWDATTEPLPTDYDIVVSNYADLLHASGKTRQARQLEERARQRRGA